jgi:hypothetical protein
MEKQNLEREVLKNITKRKFYFLTIMFLIILSGFLLFNQITYMNSAYDENRNKLQIEKVKYFYLILIICELKFKINILYRTLLFLISMCLPWNNKIN